MTPIPTNGTMPVPVSAQAERTPARARRGLKCMSSSERLLRAVQFNTISVLRTRLGSERFIEWLTIPCQEDGMTPVEALESGMWQEVAELAEDAMPKGVENF
jgi:hypothetical protein